MMDLELLWRGPQKVHKLIACIRWRTARSCSVARVSQYQETVGLLFDIWLHDMGGWKEKHRDDILDQTKIASTTAFREKKMIRLINMFLNSQ